MFFLNLLNTYLVIALLAAVVPAIALLVYVYQKDKVEQEPIGLILRLVRDGALAGIVSIVFETILDKIFPHIISPDNPYYTIFFAFIVVAAVEEGTKFAFLKHATWYNPEFNFSFDGIVYSVSVSLGFAAFENIGYVFNYGLSVAPTRAILAIPGHMSFAVFMGYFYARAKKLNDTGDSGSAKVWLALAYLAAVFFHGFYDSCAMMQSGTATAVFVVFVIVMFFLAFRLVNRESSYDQPV